MELQMTAPCLLGLEGLVAEELRQMDAREVTAENGRVFFNGDQAMLALPISTAALRSGF